MSSFPCNRSGKEGKGIACESKDLLLPQHANVACIHSTFVDSPLRYHKLQQDSVAHLKQIAKNFLVRASQ